MKTIVNKVGHFLVPLLPTRWSILWYEDAGQGDNIFIISRQFLTLISLGK